VMAMTNLGGIARRRGLHNARQTYNWPDVAILGKSRSAALRARMNGHGVPAASDAPAAALLRHRVIDGAERPIPALGAEGFRQSFCSAL